MWQNILADMLFNKDKFKLPHQQWAYTQHGEPTIHPTHSTHTVKMKNGETRQLKLTTGTIVAVWCEAK